MRPLPIARRDFLRGSGLLVVGFALENVPARTQAAPAPATARAHDPAALDTWLAIGRDGAVTAFTGHVDLGTGVETAFAQIVAEELAVPLRAVRVVMGDTDRTPDQGRSTASQGIVSSAQPLQVAAARARIALVELAAQRWNVAPASLATADGAVFARADRAKRVTYGEMIGDRRFAITLDVASVGQWGPVLKHAVPPKPVAQYAIVGKSIPRRDVPGKVFGTFEFVHNVSLPGMLHARVLRPRRNGAHLLEVDRASLPGGLDVQIIRKRDFLAVVGAREAQVVRGAAALRARWGGGTALPTGTTLAQALRDAPVVGETTNVKRGDIEAALSAAGAGRIEAEFAIPFQLHGMIGPSCAVADVREDSATIWSGTQSPLSDRDDIAAMLGLPHDRVKLIWREASGSYGRLATDDAAADAALLSKLLGRPVRVQWMRHEEHGSEPSCPAMAISIRASLDAAGRITGIDYTQWAPSFATGEKGNELAWRALGAAPGTKRLSGWASDISYDVPAVRIRNIYVQPWLRHVYMRSPGAFQSNLAFESVVDEAAYRTGSDPVAYRLEHLRDARDRAVLERAAALATWKPRRAFTRATGAAESGQGVAFARSGARDSRIAMVLNIDADRRSGAVKLRQLTIVVDCGLLVNPDGARNQIEGAALQGLSRALKEEVRFDTESVSSLDWQGYPILRFAEIPQVTVEFIDHPELPPSAIGETGTTPAAAVLANAIFDATGRRMRAVPFTPQRLVAAASE